MVAVPRLVIAAPASGSGKTTVATGLMAAFRARGLPVSGHKAGPDYIDPGYHEVATGRPRRNLDPVLCGIERVVSMFLHGAAGAQLAIVEGVMGLFDGADPAFGLGDGDPWFGSTAHVAALLGAPVVLVVDAARAGRSIAALVAGFANFDRRVALAGVILNKVGSDRHERLLREALAGLRVPVYGAIRRQAGVATPSRHLGLIPAAERPARAREQVAQMGELIAASCDLEGLCALARTAPPLPGSAWDPCADVVSGPKGTVAVAGGPAFTFGYAEQRDLLAAAGLTVAEFDPLRDEDLPEGTGAVLIGGGFPELHAAELAANERLRKNIAAFDGPIVAECAGLLYLCEALDDHPMCGVIPARASMTPTLTLGYRRARAASDSVLTKRGDLVIGHEFHRTAVRPEDPAWELAPGGLEGHAKGNVLASYLHVHWAGYPELAARFARAA